MGYVPVLWQQWVMCQPGLCASWGYVPARVMCSWGYVPRICSSSGLCAGYVPAVGYVPALGYVPRLCASYVLGLCAKVMCERVLQGINRLRALSEQTPRWCTINERGYVHLMCQTRFTINERQHGLQQTSAYNKRAPGKNVFLAGPDLGSTVLMTRVLTT